MYVLQVKEHFEKTGYTSDDKLVEIQVLSDDEKVTTTLQDITVGWRVKTVQVLCIYVVYDMHNYSHDQLNQDGKAEVVDIPGEDKVLQFTTTTFIVSSSQTSPDDMCVSVNINGGQTPHTITVERKASRRCVCQVFYHWEGINCWKTTLAFFSENLLNVS